MNKTRFILPLIGMAALLVPAYFLVRDNTVKDNNSSSSSSVSAVSETEVSSAAVSAEVSSLIENSSLNESSQTEDPSSLAESIQADESSEGEATTDDDDSMLPEKRRKGILTNTDDIKLHDIDGNNTSFVFTYDDTEYSAIYTYDNWKIVDSYRIKNLADMEVICQALIDINPVHGKDYESYRTAKDMAYEWDQHNIAYDLLPEDNEWVSHVKDVDLNPEDQGKSFLDLYCDRTGKETIFD